MSVYKSIALLIGLTACMPTPPNLNPYPDQPVIGREQLSVLISGEAAVCGGVISESFPCFWGETQSGERIKFVEGIRGFDHRVGVDQRITIERIRYDFSGATAPRDKSWHQYVLIKP